MDKQDKQDKPKRPGKNTVVHMVPLQPYAVQFVDSEGHTRSYYAFKNPVGTFFLLDVTREDLMLTEPINVPDFARVEKLGKPVALGKPKILNPPKWLEEKMNAFLANPPQRGVEEAEVTGKEPSKVMQSALMGEE